MKEHTRTKSKQLITPTANGSNNNFSEKYFRYTKDRKFLTPKKSINLKSEPKEIVLAKTELLTKIKNPVQSLSSFPKSPKININMEIKNLNIFGNASTTSQAVKKKKLHKKTISCLGQHQRDQKDKESKNKPSEPKIKHTKAKSQENLKMSPFEWGELLAKHSKNKNNSSTNLVSKYAFCNRKGMTTDKKQKINQDVNIIIENFMMSNRYLFGVCDGHGVNGHYVSDFLRQILPQNIEYSFVKKKALTKNNSQIVEAVLKDAFLMTAKNLQESEIDITYSGSTTCLLYLQQSKLYCANLGDSRAVLFSRVNQKWMYKPLSFDHKAQDEREAYRIKMNGGRVFPYYDEEGQQWGPYRIWIQQKNVPGLAMTRSFGDYVAATVGVISQPQVTSFDLCKDDKFMIVASDGLWQFIQNDEVMELVIPAFIRNNVEEAVQILQRKAVEAWKRQDENIDDITIQVIFFKYY